MNYLKGHIIASKRDTLYRVDYLDSKMIYCDIVDRDFKKSIPKRVFLFIDVRPYFLQLEDIIKIDFGHSQPYFRVENVYYVEGKLKILCRHIKDLDWVVEVFEEFLIENILEC